MRFLTPDASALFQKSRSSLICKVKTCSKSNKCGERPGQNFQDMASHARYDSSAVKEE